MADRDDSKPSGRAGINRRGLLKCMSWAGTGVVWSLAGGVPRTLGLVGSAAAAEAAQGGLTFVQISDSHIGFHLPPNPDPTATLGEAIAKIKAMPAQPAFLVHTGDISHLSKEEQWDAADQVIKAANKQVFYIPGEHDVADADNGKAYLERYGKNTQGQGWYSFDVAGVHFVALINVFNFQPGFKSAGLATLGDEQLEWLEKDVAGRSASTPIVVLAHLPMWTIYEQWGWGTAGCRPRARLSEAFRLGDRAERPHPPDHPEGRRQHHLSYRGVDRVPAAGARGPRPLPGRCRCRPPTCANTSASARSITSPARALRP